MKNMIKKLTRRRIIIIIVIVILLFGIYQIFFKKEKSAFSLAEVFRGNLIQEVSETGQVKQGDEISLNFKNSGEIKEIDVKVGDKVEANRILAKLDTSQLEIQLSQAQAALGIANAQKNNAEISMEKDYADALSTLNDSYLKANNALIFVNYLKRAYFERGDAESITVAENRDRIDRALSDIKSYIDKAKASQDKGDIDSALSVTESDLWKIKTAIEGIRSTIEAGNYRDIVSTTDKANLDTHKSNLNTAHSNVVSSQSAIVLDKANNATASQSQSQTSENGLYQAQVDQANAQIRLLQDQIQDSYLKSPVAGQIARINKRVGEIVQSTAQGAVMSFLPTVPFEVDVDIYEEDVVKINIGNPVEISLVAVPEKTFSGKVVSIDPAEELIDGVVYYKVKIAFEEDIPENLKSGMTADVNIKTATKENVLIVPEAVIQEVNGKNIIQVFNSKSKKTEDREVEIGIKGSDGMAEIISGVNEGEKVIVK